MSRAVNTLKNLIYELEVQLRLKRHLLEGVQANWGKESGQAQYLEGKVEAYLEVLKIIVEEGKKYEADKNNA